MVIVFFRGRGEGREGNVSKTRGNRISLRTVSTLRSLSHQIIEFGFASQRENAFNQKPCLAATYVNGHLKKFNTFCSGTLSGINQGYKKDFKKNNLNHPLMFGHIYSLFVYLSLANLSSLCQC